MTDAKQLDHDAVTTLRTLAIDAVQAARSGHPGMPMGAAPMAYVLWTRFMRHNPENPQWLNRDRFILSAGHGSMLLYALLHLSGYDLPLDDLKRFRQWGSKAAGHPEYGLAPGVETTTGPLGQGFATGVGMALAERHLASRYNRPGLPIIDHYTYAIVSDGDLMEGVSAEAASLAGHLRLGKLIYLYDDNHISIEGDTELAFTEDVLARFAAYGWQTFKVTDGNHLDAVASAIEAARADTEHPSLIAVRTHIGFGSPHRQDTAKAHGEPLGEEEARLTKRAYGWPEEAPFLIPGPVLEHFRTALVRGRQWEDEWTKTWERYEAQYPDLAMELRRVAQADLPPGWGNDLPRFTPGASLATRQASGQVLNALAEAIPSLIGGSADLAPSNATRLHGAEDIGPGRYEGRNIHFGVREHAMGAVLNGLALQGLKAFGGTFLVFADYMRPAIRLASLMKLPVTYVFTHDSIGVGEDGPTHQPVEHLASLRAIPGLVVFRPADANETVQGWKWAMASRTRPVALILTRQSLPVLDPERAQNARFGGYVLSEAQEGDPQGILIASGSEVHLALAAQAALNARGIGVRVVSLPSWEIFEQQPQAYRDQVLPPTVIRRVVIEAASPMGWERYAGERGKMVTMTTFGASAPAAELFERFGFTVDQVVAAMQTLVDQNTEDAHKDMSGV